MEKSDHQTALTKPCKLCGQKLLKGDARVSGHGQVPDRYECSDYKDPLLTVFG